MAITERNCKTLLSSSMSSSLSSSLSSLSSSCFTTTTSSSYSGPLNYDVFLSFRGETRDNFTSHLYDKLRDEKLKTFIDYRLDKGKDLSTILKKIEESAISVIIFSEKFADSEWCLDEVVKIVECMETKGQRVLPVFYRVDPSDVQDDDGSYRKKIAHHEHLAKLKNDKATIDKVGKWVRALKIVACQAGWDSKVTRPDSQLVKEIVDRVLTTRKQTSPNCDSRNFVGIESRMWEIESLLCTDSDDIRIIGIWGMGGMGKTTIAKAIFKQLSEQFESSCFLENVKNRSEKRGLDRLQYHLYSKILDDENLDMGSLDLENSFIRSRLCQKRVLIVLDDVTHPIQFQKLLLGGCKSFGSGSRIIVTGRDHQVLKNVGAKTYELKGLHEFESLQLFSWNAFKQNQPPEDRKLQSNVVVSYCKGNPLALTVLGSSLFDRSEQDWESALNGLTKVPHPEIHQALRTSYDGLDAEEKSIFLDIACFFGGEDRNYVINILDAHFPSAYFRTSVLIDRALISVSHDKFVVHDLMRQMALSIVREESNYPGNRSRLWDPKDVCNVLMKKKGTEANEVVCMDLSKTEEMKLDPDTFGAMDNLRVLRFCTPDFSTACRDKVHFPHGLQYLPDRLTCLHWDAFPCKSLPSDFCAESLVELKLRYSKVKQLWTGGRRLGKLKGIDLSHSKLLTSIPDLSGAENIESINLEGCESLVELPSSIQHLHKLKYLNMSHCKNLRILPRRIDSQYLEILNISNCPNVKKCPEISGNLEELDLSWTAIKDLPQSIIELESLATLSLIGCSNFTKFPKIMKNLTNLYLSETSIKEVPSSIEFFTGLENLELRNCKKLARVSNRICKLKCLKSLDLSFCPKLVSFPEISEPMEGIRSRNLSDNRHLKRLTRSSCDMKPLRLSMHPSENDSESLPANVIQHSDLNSLKLSHCKNLRSLEIPQSLNHLEANDCASLETLSNSKISKFNAKYLNFLNCFKLDQKAVSDVVASGQSTIHQMATKYYKDRDQVKFLFPGRDIPQWFYRRSVGSLITACLPSNWQQFRGIAFCIVFALEDPSRMSNSFSPNGCHIDANALSNLMLFGFGNVLFLIFI